MQYRTLGRTGIKVSPYALGALALGTSIGNPDHDDSARIIGKALDAGINVIDTSDAYGESEVAVGKALKGRRDGVVLATKFSRPTGDDPNHQGASRRWIMTAAENSLRPLQTDYIDLYQVHRPDPATDIEETTSPPFPSMALNPRRDSNHQRPAEAIRVCCRLTFRDHRAWPNGIRSSFDDSE